MGFKPTKEQSDIVQTVLDLYKQPGDHILKVEAVAGASKTTTSVMVAEALGKDIDAMYLAYNKAIADEASGKFPNTVECKTTHSLAYRPIVSMGLNLDGEPAGKRTVGFFGYKSFTGDDSKRKYETRMSVVTFLESFFLSRSTVLEDYFKEYDGMLSDAEKDLAVKYFGLMVDAKMPVPHSFYLKLFHILLSTDCIHYDKPFDLLILDEAGDINGVTLEIFMLLPAKVKLMVGDSLQNIYSFNHTINGFEALKGIGVDKYLTQSFRCSKEIAGRVQDFVHQQIGNPIDFFGTDHEDCTIKSKATIARTNSGLIPYMIEFLTLDKKFNLTRKVSDIFEVMMILLNLSSKSTIYNPQYKELKLDAKVYETSPHLHVRFKTIVDYVFELHGEYDPAIASAVRTIRSNGRRNIWEAYNLAKECEEDDTVYEDTLTTAHSSKGLTFDSVEIATDFNLTKILEVPRSEREESDNEELRLYYVACTRARVELLSAKFL